MNILLIVDKDCQTELAGELKGKVVRIRKLPFLYPKLKKAYAEIASDIRRRSCGKGLLLYQGGVKRHFRLSAG